MNQGILATFDSLLDDDRIAEASLVFGESPSAVGTTLRMVGPAMLAIIMKRGSSRCDMSELFAGIMNASVDEDVECSFLSDIFGDRVDLIAGALAQIVGVKPGSVHRMLVFAASTLGLVIRNVVEKRGLDAQGLASALEQERDSMTTSMLDRRVAAAMGIDDVRQTADSFGSAEERPTEAAASSAASYARQRWTEPVARRSSWGGWALGAVAAVLGLLLIVGPWNPRADGPTVAMNVDFDRVPATLDSDDRLAIGVAAATVQANGGLLVPRARDSWNQRVPRPAPTLLAGNIDELTNLELFCVAMFAVAVVYFVVGSIQSLKGGRPARRRSASR